MFKSLDIGVYPGALSLESTYLQRHFDKCKEDF